MSCSSNQIETVTWKRGAVGKLIEFNDLSDEAGLVDLSAYTITFWAETFAGRVVIEGVTVTKRDQSINPGDCYYLLDTDTADIAPGEYRGELRLTAGSNVDFWPTNEDGDRTFFNIIVQDHIGS